MPCLFRPPYLSKGDNLITICKNKGFPIIEGLSSKDYLSGKNSGSAEDQVQTIIDSARDWLIALNHDPQSGIPENILKAIPLMIDGLRAKGYYLLTVSEMLAMKGGSLIPGEVYDGF